MSTSYHVSPNGPRLCKAEHGGCPYAAQGEPHFDTQVEAQQHYETKMGAAFGNLETIRKTPKEEFRQVLYQERDEFLATVNAVKASAPAQKVLSTLNFIKDIPRRIDSKLLEMETAGQDRMALRQAELELKTAELKSKINKIGARMLESSNRANAIQQQRALELRSLKTVSDQHRTRPRLKGAHGLSKGDELPGNLKIYKVEDNGGSMRVFVRNTRGQFAGHREFKDTDVVSYSRPSKRDLRNGAERRPVKKLSESAFAQRVKAASSIQREAFQVLRGVDTSKMERIQPPAPRDKRKRPLGVRYRRATATVAGAQRDLLFSLHHADSMKRNRPNRIKIGAPATT